MHFAPSTYPQILQQCISFVFESHWSHFAKTVSRLQFKQMYEGNSDSTKPVSSALWNDLILPPSFPIGNKVCGSPSIFLTFAFSGRPILAPMKVPDLSFSFISDIEFIISSASSFSDLWNCPIKFGLPRPNILWKTCASSFSRIVNSLLTKM